MQNFKNFLWKLTITAIIWIVSRFIPAMLQLLFPVGSFLWAVIMVGSLLLAWYLSGCISKWKYPKTIEKNLSVIGTIECLGIVIEIISLVRYTLTSGILLFVISFGLRIWLCYILKEETKDRYKALYGSDKT